MPTYEYRCAKCGTHLEVYQSFSEDPLTKHERCGGKLTKVLSPAGIVLKGSGFYKTDSSESARSRSKARTRSEPGGDKATASTPESKPAKPESTSSKSDGGSAAKTA